MMGNRYIRIVIILGMVAVMCGTVNAVAVGVVANTQAMSVGAYPVCTAPCECIAESTAAIRWGAAGYERCDKTICGQDAGGNVQYYCIHNKIGSTVSAATTAVTTTAPVTVSQETVNAPVTSAAVPATPSPALLETGAVTRKSPVGIATILAAIGAALLAASGMRRK